MICDVCKSRNASVRVKKMSGGMLTDYLLCTECAIRFGYAKMINRFYTVAGEGENTLRCSCCGCTMRDITEMGMVGCGQCYEMFRNKLTETIEKIHGKVTYAGRVPPSASPRVQAESRIASARAELAEAIADEDFERAAQLRDYIHALQNAQ